MVHDRQQAGAAVHLAANANAAAHHICVPRYGPKPWRRMGGMLAVVLGLWACSAPSLAAALVSQLDQFVIYRNGSVWVNDTFGDGLPPPSGQGTIGPMGGALTYFTQGGFLESDGKVTMASETAGLPLFLNLVNVTTGTTVFTPNELTRSHTARVLSNTSQASTAGLKTSHTFEVLALYDLTVPTTRSNNYGIGLVDNFAASGPTRDRMRLSVLSSTATGAPRVSFWRNDGTVDPTQNITFGSHALETGHEQIVLKLSRSDANDNTIVASYAYLDEASVGMDLSNATNLASLGFRTIANTSTEPNTIFNQFIHTRAEFRQLARDEDNRFDFARLTTGSPVTISQEVFTGTSASFLGFNYRFETTTGVLSVDLGGTVLGTITAPAAVSDDFASAEFLIDGALLNQNLMLSLTLDGVTGSKILLDSISFTGLTNGNFASGDLAGWDITASGTGSAGVLTITAVPEPESYLLMALGLGLVGLVARRRQRILMHAA